MKTTINGKRYNSEKCEELASYDHRSHSNNYSGTSALMRASDGTYLVHTDSNGQDCWLQDGFYPCEDVLEFVRRCELSDDQEARLVELSVITIVD
jgi:hypothetical protein